MSTPTKECRDCKITKPLSDYYKQWSVQSPLTPICKTCHNWRSRVTYHKDPDAKNTEYDRIRHKAWTLTARGKRALNEASKRSHRKHPKEMDARYRTRELVRKGLLIKEACYCGETKVHGHHAWGYDGENATRVQWLCARHHSDAHWKKGKTL